MKKDRVLELLNKLEEYEINEEDASKLLLKGDIVLEKLLSLKEVLFRKAVIVINSYNNTNDILEALDILNNAKNVEVFVVLKDEDAIKAGIAIEGAKIINESKNYFNASCANYVLTNKDAIEAGIALEGAKIINESKKEFNAKYAKCVLRDDITIRAGIALEGAKIINESISDFNAHYASQILRDNLAIKAGIALDSARLINKTTDRESAFRLYNTIMDKLYEMERNKPKVNNIFILINEVSNANEEEIRLTHLSKRLIRINKDQYNKN